jgi:DNA gyrase inhibitor GyrI
MSELDVRIVKLEPCRVAAALGYGDSPEGEAWDKILAYAAANDLPAEPDAGARFYGFNNPDPSPGTPNYGYEQWLVVDESAQATADVEVKPFDGGLYAVTRCPSLTTIGETWQQLVAWFEDSPYHKGTHQWLEQCLSAPSLPPEKLVLDLYLPIVE